MLYLNHRTIRSSGLRTLFMITCLLALIPARGGCSDLNSTRPINIRSSITITAPNNSTVWTIPSTVEIKWKTQNIPASRSIKFYLIKDDVVEQELGVFPNGGQASGVKLNRGLQAGSNYRVMAIELFPDDKTSIAKFATPFFTMVKERPKGEQVTAASVIPAVETPRQTFDGRNINYVSELTVDNEHIRINLWDHGRKDGDIVSIYLNGEAIVSRHSLTYNKEPFELLLDSGKANDLFLYAHNLGEFPPNTVSIEIKDDSSSENIILNSDLKSCEAVLITVKE